MEIIIDTICEYEGLSKCPDSYTKKCYTCKNNKIMEYKDVPMEILLLHKIFGEIPEEAIKLHKER